MTSWLLLPSPATGAYTWSAVAELLRADGDHVEVVSFHPTLTASPGWAERQVELAARHSADVLVGHSWAGTLLPAVATRTKPSACLYVDASFPRPGRSFAQDVPELLGFVEGLAEDGWTPPWHTWWGPDELAEALPDPAVRAAFEADCRPLPIGMFHEPALPDEPSGRSGYLRLSKAYDLADAAARGWPALDFDGDHLSMLREPAEVVRLMRELA